VTHCRGAASAPAGPLITILTVLGTNAPMASKRSLAVAGETLMRARSPSIASKS
jgi:hypothetical protein